MVDDKHQQAPQQQQYYHKNNGGNHGNQNYYHRRSHHNKHQNNYHNQQHDNYNNDHQNWNYVSRVKQECNNKLTKREILQTTSMVECLNNTPNDCLLPKKNQKMIRHSEKYRVQGAL